MPPTPAPILLFAVAAAADWVAVGRGWRMLEWIAKPVAIVALLAYCIAAGPALPATPSIPAGGVNALLAWALVLAALVASLVGDLLLLPPARFTAGVLAFLVAQLAYLVRFASEGMHPAGFVAGMLVAVVVVGAFGPPIVRGAARDGFGVPVVVYLIAISLMALAATGTGIALAAAGAWLFVASDTILAWDRFVRRTRGPGATPAREVARDEWWRVVNMATYHLAQLALVLALVPG